MKLHQRRTTAGRTKFPNALSRTQKKQLRGNGVDAFLSECTGIVLWGLMRTVEQRMGGEGGQHLIKQSFCMLALC
jgi:hypothetical protein